MVLDKPDLDFPAVPEAAEIQHLFEVLRGLHRGADLRILSEQLVDQDNDGNIPPALPASHGFSFLRLPLVSHRRLPAQHGQGLDLRELVVEHPEDGLHEHLHHFDLLGHHDLRLRRLRRRDRPRQLGILLPTGGRNGRHLLLRMDDRHFPAATTQP